MAGLRDLLGKFTQVTQTEIQAGQVAVSGQIGTLWTMLAFCQSPNENPGCCDTKNRGLICAWCWPADTTSVKFSIWGGGGAGASFPGCHGGSPGGAAAYAYKTLQNQDAGTCYELNAGFGGQSVCNSCIGCQGGESYVNGAGLSNFCAEGGYGGRVNCFCYWRQCCISGTDNDGYHYMGNETCCSLFFGADGGAFGLPGFYTNYCGCGSDQNNCWIKQGVPFPGGIFTQDGGHNLIRVNGNACRNEWANCSVNGFGGQRFRDNPGAGGMSGTTCGGGSCCGQHGGPGMIKIEYR